MTAVLAAVVVLGALALPGRADAVITPTSNASTLAQAAAQNPANVTGAAFVAIPPNGAPHGTGSPTLAGFPTDGMSYAILTSGSAALADQPNSSGSSGANDGGGAVRGNTDRDVSILRIDLDVPAGANCLSIDFRFLSDEYPEYVGSSYNDAFIAELDTSNWTTSGSTISAPNNFAFDPMGNVISINAAGAASMSAGEAAGTTYDGATPLLTASTPVTPGAHSLYLSIFDQGDNVYDSAAFVDRLVLGTSAPGGCQPGATVLSVSKTTSTPLVPPGGTVNYTITVNNGGNIPATLTSITDSLPAGFTYIAGSTSGATTSDPGISGQDLTWTGSFLVPAGGSASLQFSATASMTPGDYPNNAGGTSDTAPVTPTGPTATVTVQEAVACGNSMTETGETCDDGNTNSCDGCSATCQTEGCGDGIRCPSEQCEDGNTDDCDGCSATCQPESCGDGTTCANQGEQCDPPGPGCSATCQSVLCGNGMLDPGETCDPPDSPQPPNGNLCRADCTFCGDAILQTQETCDDGNTHPGCPTRADNCRNDCTDPLCKDPARITFNDSGPDEFKGHGLIHPSEDFDPSDSGVRLVLENSMGVVYSAIIPSTTIETSAGYLFKVSDYSARVTGGVRYLKVVKRRTRASSIKFRVYGDLSAATEPHMRLIITIGKEQFTVEGDWRQLPNGWWLPDLQWD